ncbi:hypothetical protein DP43_5061 [Burkholderia pseudomallei]|nr:hypothetical protein DP43_5061 [Burkholderia pseudomallei]
MARADQAAHHQADRLEHPPHLAVAPFGKRDVIPVIRAFAAAVANAQEIRRAVVELDAVQQLLTRRLGQLADDAHRVLALDAIARMHEAVREIARRRQHQQAFGVEVEAADREPFRGLHRRQPIEHGRAALRIRVAHDLARRLVIQQHARRLARQLALDRLAVDPHLIGRHDPLADVRRLAVHRHPAGNDELFHLAARAHAGFREHLVQLRRVVVRRQHALRLSLAAPAQHRRAHAAARRVVVGVERRRNHVGEHVVLARLRGRRNRRGSLLRASLRLSALPRRAFALARRLARRLRCGVLAARRASGRFRDVGARAGIGRRRRVGAFGRIGMLRFRGRSAARDQAARPAPQTAARAVFAARVRCGLLGCVVGARRRNGMRGFGRIDVVGISQNNLKMSGLAPVAGTAGVRPPVSGATLRRRVLVVLPLVLGGRLACTAHGVGETVGRVVQRLLRVRPDRLGIVRDAADRAVVFLRRSARHRVGGRLACCCVCRVGRLRVRLRDVVCVFVRPRGRFGALAISGCIAGVRRRDGVRCALRIMVRRDRMRMRCGRADRLAAGVCRLRHLARVDLASRMPGSIAAARRIGFAESRRRVDVHIGSPGVIIGWIADPCRQAVRRPFLPRLVGARRIFVAQNHRIARRLGNLARLRGGGVRLGRDGRRFAVAARVIGEIDRLLREQARLQMRGRLLERGQIVERLQAEVVEKLFCRRVERRTARHVAMTDHFDPAAVLELLDDLRVHRDAADLLDVAARDRLPVRDDRERLQHGARILRRLLGMQAIEIRAHRRLALEAPARRERDEFDPPSGPFLFQIFEQCSDCIRRHAVGKELAQIAELQRFLRADQGSLEDDLRLLGIHAARSDPVVKRTGSIEQTKGTEDALARF